MIGAGQLPSVKVRMVTLAHCGGLSHGSGGCANTLTLVHVSDCAGLDGGRSV